MSITEKLNKIKSCKEEIKQAIMDKGVDMSGVSLEGYATKISEIQTGGGSGDYLDALASLSDTYYSTVSEVIPYAFIYKKIQSIDLPNCISVGSQAFGYCSSLQAVNLPNCISVGNYAFQRCSSLQSVNLQNCSYVGLNVFYACSSLQSIDLPNCSYVGGYAFQSCSSLQSVNLPNCSYVGGYAFQSCSSLQSVNLPNCISVGNYAFQYCRSLQSIDLPNCIIVSGSAFDGCSSLQSVNLPNCGYLDSCAFSYCRSLQSIDLPNCSLINQYAFNGCSILSTVNASICICIYSSAFKNCLNLSILDLRSTYSCSLLNSNTFSLTPFASGIGSIYVHAAHLSQFQNATNWTYFSNCLVGVGDPTRPLLSFDSGRMYGDTQILYNTFSRFIGVSSNEITSIDLPNCRYIQGVSDIYTSPLQNCKITSLDLPKCEYLGSNIFKSNSTLTTVNLPMCSFMEKCALQTIAIKTLNIGTSISTVCKLSNVIFFNDYIPSIFVPMSLVDAYKSAPYWSDYASQIYGV